MKQLVKAILKEYINRNEFKHSIQQAFLRHFVITKIKNSNKYKRKEIFEIIEEELRLPRNNFRRKYFGKCLREIGIVPVFTSGYQYFVGIRKL